MEKTSEKKVIPVKNYIILIIIFIVTAVITIYVNAWIKTYKISNDISPMANLVQEITLSDLEVTMSETTMAILYIANDVNYELDNDILQRVNANELNDYFYYMNVGDVSEKETIDVLKSFFDNLSDDINAIPMLIYIKDGKAEKIIDSEKRTITVNDFNVIVDSYLTID